MTILQKIHCVGEMLGIDMILNSFLGENDCNIIIGNWSCEDVWFDKNAMKLPRIDLYNKKSALEKLDELFIYLARKQDIVVLRQLPDTQFVNYLIGLNIDIPIILAPEKCDTSKSLGELIVNDNSLMNKLNEYVLKNEKENVTTNLVPYGVTIYEEKIAKIISAQLYSQNSIVSKLNCKITLNDYANKHRINFPKSIVCYGVNELEKNALFYFKNYGSVVIKEIFGSAGSGLLIINTEEQIRSICSYIKEHYDGDGAIIIQQWHESVVSYNHQYVVSNNNIIPYSYSKQLFNEHRGKIVGSYFEQLDDRSERYKKHYTLSVPILNEIQNSGYIGIVGFDSLVGMTDDTFFPVIDINCRINLSTIFRSILVSYFPARYACFIGKEYLLSNILPFEELNNSLRKYSYAADTKEGIVILNSNSLNDNFLNNKSKYGRIYFALLADTIGRLRELYSFIITNKVDF